MKKIADIKYDNVKFRFISNHYDCHLSGTCYYKDELCQFKNKYPDYNEENDEWEEMIVEIYQLTIREKIRWYFKQWLFEKCVGYHWSYPYRKTGERPFCYRRPQWLYKRIFKLYYRRF